MGMALSRGLSGQLEGGYHSMPNPMSVILKNIFLPAVWQTQAVDDVVTGVGVASRKTSSAGTVSCNISFKDVQPYHNKIVDY